MVSAWQNALLRSEKQRDGNLAEIASRTVVSEALDDWEFCLKDREVSFRCLAGRKMVLCQTDTREGHDHRMNKPIISGYLSSNCFYEYIRQYEKDGSISTSLDHKLASIIVRKSMSDENWRGEF